MQIFHHDKKLINLIKIDKEMFKWDLRGEANFPG